jgi:uncharacterized alkaline shock family protein YloU
MNGEVAPEAGGGTPPQGTWSIDEDQIAEIARNEVCSLDGVVGVSETGLIDRISGHSGGARATIRGGRVTLKLSVVVEYGRPLPCIVDQIRQRAASAVEGMTGYHVFAVDITVSNLHVRGEPLASREPGASGPGSDGGGRIDF